MSTKEFASGSIVALKAGGPPMTVRYTVGFQAARDTGNEIGVHVDWCDALGQPHRECYSSHQLRLASFAPACGETPHYDEPPR